MRSVLFATLFLIVGLLAVRPLEAQQIRSPYRYIDERQSLGVYAGYLLTSPGTPEVGPQSAPIFGVRYNLRFTGPLSGEAAISFAPAERQVITTNAPPAAFQPQPTGQVQPMNLLVAEAGLRFHVTGPRAWRGLAPYGIATGGVAADLSGQGEADEALPEAQRFRFGPSFAVGVGAGTDWFLTERLSLRLEVRDHIFRLSVPAGLRETGVAEAQWVNNIGFSIGTSLHF
jgi:hypothetical protein